ncbi:Hypothetical protein R9X50_00059200 [Acrodontium crateriforme]|uniref:Uncharacterized protein n=1 Tax=Acrodontium crateriforme TaxID=150365 RepID=A0AAQ3M3H1_9PEZI|nr:Hypothetical protein R9X50_00059200 [Acrodontium crateriforme]
METESPTMATQQYMSPIETSPASSYREHFRRRSSSFSSNHDRSPTTPRSKNRFSNASQYSTEFQTLEEGEGAGLGLGNLADELDQLDDDDYEDEVTEAAIHHHETEKGQSLLPDGARDSGIDVSYASSSQSKEASKAIGGIGDPPEEEEEHEEQLSIELEEALNNIARMAVQTSNSEDPLIPRTVSQLQDLGNQSSLESGAQRFNTSTNSLASNLLAQGKSLQSLSTSLLSPFAFVTSLNSAAIEDAVPLVDELLAQLPLHDPRPLQGLQSLDRANTIVVETLSQLIDTLQMGKQKTNEAARRLRTTQMIVAELRRDDERADRARVELQKENFGDWLKDRKCAAECKDVLSGFEEVCDGLRTTLVQESVSAA